MMDDKVREDLDWLAVTVGTLGSLLIEKEICTLEEFNERFNFCLSDFDQYSAECRDKEKIDDEE